MIDLTSIYFDPDGINQLKSRLASLTDSSEIRLMDQLGGFDHDGNNDVLHTLDSFASESKQKIKTEVSYIVEPRIAELYPNLDFYLGRYKTFEKSFVDYRMHPPQQIRNFVCSFNGAENVGRKFLLSILHRFGWYNPETVSKNFAYNVATLDGHIRDYCDSDRHRYYRKFFIGDLNDDFFETINSFGLVRFDHGQNVRILEQRLTSSFLHLVSETLPTSYYPLITEKCLYSIVTRGLFLCYAHPGWHDFLAKYYGFRKYDRIFDYGFDSITNPVERLVALTTMISKFSHLSQHDWNDLYEMELHTIEHNYDWYFSGSYLKHLQSQTRTSGF